MLISANKGFRFRKNHEFMACLKWFAIIILQEQAHGHQVEAGRIVYFSVKFCVNEDCFVPIFCGFEI
jgi:hypothetical protein